jgi:hypothetical protein
MAHESLRGQEETNVTSDGLEDWPSTHRKGE